MMNNKRNILTIAFVAITLIGFSLSLSSYKTYQTKQKTMLKFMNDDYPELWAKVDSLDRLGQPKSALEIVDVIYEKAAKDKNPTQIIKSTVYQNRYNAMLEEDGLVKSINRMSVQMEAADFPVKPILQSMLAEAYQGYFANNQWKIRDRTATDNFQKNDIQTWTEEDFVKKTAELYLASISDERIKQVELMDLKDILYYADKDGIALRSTLYDFLAHRAVDYFSNEQTYLTQPAYQFTIDKSEYFAEADAFSKLKIETKDTASLKHKAMLIYQDLIKSHLDNDDKSALIDVDLKRLAFIYNNYNGVGKNNFYEATLQNMQKRHFENPMSSEIAAKIAQLYVNDAAKYDKAKGDDHKWDFKTAHSIASDAIKKHPNSMGASQCQAIINTIEQKSLGVTMEQVTASNQPILALANYRNVSKSYVKIVKTTHDEVREFNKIEQDIWLKKLNGKTAVQNFTLDLPNDGDFRSHDIEFKLDNLDKGLYYVLISDNADFSYENHAVGYTTVHISNLAFAQRKDDNDKTVFILTDRTTGEPQKDVTAEYFTEEYNRIKREYVYKSVGKQTSDERGFITANVNANRYFQVKFSKGDDILHLTEGYSNYQYSRNKEISITTHIFLDRGIYRPGQTVYFKGLAVQNETGSKIPTIVTNEKVTVWLYDVNYQEVAKMELQTNEFGTFNGSFTAPQGGLAGQMRIQTDIKGHSGSKYFSVEEYKRPKFEVTFNPIEGSFKLDETVKTVGKAKAYAGSNIDGAMVKYRVTRQAYFPYWRWWYWGRNPYNTQATEIKNGETTTDENGEFKVDFTALADKSIPKDKTPFFNFTVYADVTDINGETHSSQTVVKVSYIGLEANIAVSEQINKTETEAFEISTKNLSGTFEAAKGTVKIERLKTPENIYKNRLWTRAEFSNLDEKTFKKEFPNYTFGEEDLTKNWAIVETVLDTKFDTEKSTKVELNKIKNWEQGRYRLTMKTQDKFDNPIEQIKEFTLFSPSENTVPTNDAFWFSTNKTTAEPGETVSIQIGSGYKKSHVLYEVEQDGKILLSKWLQVKGKTTIDLPIVESHRGNIHYSLLTIQNDRIHTEAQTVYVPWSNKDLKIEYSTFRDKMQPGSDEEWQIKISGAKGDKVAAEMVAAMYDASLDAFRANTWSASFFGQSYAQRAISQGQGFGQIGTSLIANNWQPPYISFGSRIYPSLNWFGFTFYQYSYAWRKYSYAWRTDGEAATYSEEQVVFDSAPAPKMSRSEKEYLSKEEDQIIQKMAAGNVPLPLKETTVTNQLVNAPEETEKTDFSEVQVRTNLNETVFFYPDLMTDAEGNIIIKFKMNEALTRWKFLGFAHTKDLQYAFTQKEVVTQKELMVMPNPPRFFRENDKIEFTAKISNLSDKDLTGVAKLLLFDAITMQPIDAKLDNNIPEIDFSAKQGQSDAVSWSLHIPDFGVNAVTYRIVAKAGNFSDGEEATLPVLTNRMLLVETMPLPVRGGMTKEFNFAAMQKANGSKTLKNHEMTLEFTSNPAWYAVQSLPYLMEYPYECTEQIFSRYYANTLATSVANSSPQIQKVFNSWKNITPEALQSNLAKNEELKYALLEETPWVLQAQSEAQQKKNIGLLFDLNRMSNELDKALKTMEQRQSGSGGFAWFPGGRDSWYITQYIVEGMGHLQYLGAIGEKSGLQKKQQAGDMIGKAVGFCDQEFLQHYNDLLEQKRKYKNINLEDDHLDYMVIHYLYARSFFLDLPIPKDVQVAFDYYVGQSEKYWLNKGMYSEGMIALALQRLDKPTQPALIVKSLKERSLNNEEMGMYWKYPSGYWWYQAPIETHALMIEVFDEVANDAKAVDDLKTWLLKNRQTTHWKTTKATASAVYAMLLRGDNWLAETQDVEIYFSGKKFDQSKIKKEAGSGYFKYKFGAENITNDMANVKVVNPNKNPAWGAMYWQYFEDYDQIKTFEDTPLKLKKQLFKEVNTDKGPVIKPIGDKEKLKTGDKIVVRIELRVDRDMEYVHLKDTRASGFEPINVFSQYKWQGGLGYYESTSDASTNFFIGYLPKGTYVFEYPLRANLKGDFSNGITTIQCMYAPEFTSHSEGVRVVIE